jgi:hypothetical protein
LPVCSIDLLCESGRKLTFCPKKNVLLPEFEEAYHQYGRRGEYAYPVFHANVSVNPLKTE